MSIADKLTLINAAKLAQRAALIEKGVDMDGIPFSAYDDAIRSIVAGITVVSPVPELIYNMPFTNVAEPLGGNIWYVKPGGEGAKNGTSWSNAFATRQEAVNAASYGDHIRVWEGQYYLSTVQTPKAGVSEYYGFNGDGSWATRQPFRNPSILDAGFTANTFVNDSVTFLDEQIIDGMWIQNGRVTGDGGGMKLVNKTYLRNGIILNTNATGNGGGAYLNNTSTASNCIIANNNAANYGGGAYVTSSSTASNCVVINNNAGGYGGGAYVTSSSTASNCIIANNNAGAGGGVSLNTSSTASNCIIANNNATSLGGGGAFLTVSSTVSNCFIANNNATSLGGGACLYSSGRAINTTCINNTATTGDNFYLNSNSQILYNCVSWGGNIYLAQANYAYKIYNCASNFALTGVANWGAIADVRNFLPLSAFPFKAPGTSPFDGSGVFIGVNTLGRTEYALEYINSMILPKLPDAHLPAGSPLIGAGYYEAGVTPATDADGKTRPVPPSIGAYEP